MKQIFNKNLLLLTKGEIQRAIKYKILPIGIALSFVWLVIIFFARNSIDTVTHLITLFIYTDTGIMTVMFIGITIFFEKSEGSAMTLLVLPVKKSQMILSKLIVSSIIGFVSGLIVSIGTIIMTDVKINVFYMLLSIFVVSFSHGILGLAFTMGVKDFNTLMTKLFIYSFALVMPTLFVQLNVLPNWFEYVLLVSPEQTATLLYNAVVMHVFKWYKIVITVLSTTILSIVLLKCYILPNYAKKLLEG